MLDTMTGMDVTKLEKFIETALLIDKAANDETVIMKVIKQSEEAIIDLKYERALQMLQDSWSFE